MRRTISELIEPSTPFERVPSADDDEVRADLASRLDDLPRGMAARLQVPGRDVTSKQVLARLVDGSSF